MKIKKEKKPLNIAQRVEILLREGVDSADKWIGVKAYDGPGEDCVGGDAWSVEWQRLHAHHLEECAHLRAVIAEMREQILALDEQLDNCDRTVVLK